MTLRASGKVDFYWNFTIISTPECKLLLRYNAIEFFEDITINFDNMYLKGLNESIVYTVGIKYKERIGMSVAEKKAFVLDHWVSCFQRNLRSHVRIF